MARVGSRGAGCNWTEAMVLGLKGIEQSSRGNQVYRAWHKYGHRWEPSLSNNSLGKYMGCARGVYMKREEAMSHGNES